MQHNENVRLKLDEKNNVIVAKCAGFSTEIFMPVVVGGRLSIINVVPQRRCQCISTNVIVAKSAKPLYAEAPDQSDRNAEISSLNCHFTADFQSSRFSDQYTTSTPDVARCQPGPRQSLSFLPRVARNISLQFDENEKIRTDDCLHSKEQDQMINNDSIEAPDICNITCSEIRIPLGNLSSFDWPQTPNGSSSSVHCSEQQFAANKLLKSNEALPKWRKVLTPIRTYSRQRYSHTSSLYQERGSTNDLTVSTDGLKAEKKVVILKPSKNQVIIDKKLKISPKSFKHQLHCTKSNKELRIEMLQEYKNCKNELKKKNAFELLTSPTEQTALISSALKEQFRTRCVSRAVSTYPKYKKLAAIENQPNYS